MILSAALFMTASCGFAAELNNESKTVASGETYECDGVSRTYGNETSVSAYNMTVASGGTFIVNGDITNEINGVNSTNETFVGGLLGTGTATVAGTVVTTINGAETALNKVYGGNGGNQDGSLRHGDNSKVGAVEITMNDGTISGFILGSGALGSDVDGDVNIAVKGGTIKDGIYGAGASAHVGGDVNITVNGGNIDCIYGGGGNGGSTIGGSVNIVIAGTAVVSDVCGGAWYTSSGSIGAVNITVTDSAKIDGTIYGTQYEQTVSGAKTLNIEDYTGTLAIANFDDVKITGTSEVEFSSAFAADVLLVDYSVVSVVLADGTTFKTLSVVVDSTLESGAEEDLGATLEAIFGNSAETIESAIETSTALTLVDKNGQTWSATYSNGIATVVAAIPEPSAFGLLAGICALAFVAARRRRNV